MCSAMHVDRTCLPTLGSRIEKRVGALWSELAHFKLTEEGQDCFRPHERTGILLAHPLGSSVQVAKSNLRECIGKRALLLARALGDDAFRDLLVDVIVD